MYKKIILTTGIVVICGLFMQTAAQASVLQAQRIICKQRNDREYCTSLNGRELNGKIAVQRDDGTVAGVCEFRKGYRNGFNVFLNYRGDLVQSVMFKDGIQDGITYFYHDNRKPWIAAPYKKGVLEGTSDVYDSDGKLRGQFVYSNGVLKRGYCRSKYGRRITYPNKQSVVAFNQPVTCGRK